MSIDAQPAGLSEAEAAARLLRFGPNVIAEARSHPMRSVLAKVSGPVPWLLEAAIVLELVAGNYTEAVIVAALVVFNGLLSAVQEGRARNALVLLRARLAVQARVLRNGAWKAVDAGTLVPGDVVHVRMGDIVPADIGVSDGSVSVDQAALTGESGPVTVGPDGALYAGSIVQRGEATGQVTATGSHTSFGRTAELMRKAKTASHLEETIFRIVWVLLLLDGLLVVATLFYGAFTGLPASALLPFVLILIVATVPVALPATFTLSASIGAVELANSGALVTHLGAIEEAAAMDFLCTDKTGTITANRLDVVAVRAYGTHSEGEVLGMAAAASDASTQDPIDLAILAAAKARGSASPGTRVRMVPFDPATKRSEAEIIVDDAQIRALKGAPAVIAAIAGDIANMNDDVQALASSGARVLAVAAGEPAAPQLMGLIALGDPLREDSRPLIEKLKELGIRVVMVTGDGAPTAMAVAREVGIGQRIATRDDVHASRDGTIGFDVVAGVLPEDKLALVERAQKGGHVVGMTGDGVNDAPALKRAEVGIAVSNATDVAKDAASVVLTQPGLISIVATVQSGRRVYQRMLTYTLNKIAKTFQVSLFLGLGLLITGEFVTTPRLILLLLFANDFVTMSIASDRVGFSPRPDRWRISALAAAALAVAVPWLAFSFGTFYIARDVMGIGLAATQTLVFVMLVATGQATVYLVRERGHLWASRPSTWMLGATTADLVIVSTIASRGVLMHGIPLTYIAVLLGAVLVATLLLDMLKVPLVSRLRVSR